MGGPGGWASGRGLRNTDEFSNLHKALDGQGPGGGRGYEIGKSTGGGSYGGVGTGGLSGGVPGLVYGDDLISDLVGGSGGGHAIRGSGNAGGGGGAISFVIGGSFVLDGNGSVSANGGAGTSHSDGSGAAGSGGAIRIEASSISNFGKIEAKGGNAIGSASLGGAGGGTNRLLSNGLIIEAALIPVEDEISPSHIPSIENDLVAYWTLRQLFIHNRVKCEWEHRSKRHNLRFS